MTDLVEAVLAACDPAALPRSLQGSGARHWVALRGRGQGRKVNLLVLAEGAPALFLKTATGDGLSDLQGEQAALRTLGALDLPPGAVPTDLGLLPVGRRHVLVQSALPGTPLSVRLRSTLRPRAAAVSGATGAQEWLARLHAASRTQDEVALRARATCERLADGLRADARLSSKAESTLDRLLSAADRYEELPVPLCARHGDLWPGNVLVGPQGTGVVDWEHYEPAASPLWDLWFLFVGVAHAYPWAGRRWIDAEQAFTAAFLRPGWLADLVVVLTARHLDALGLPRDAAELLLFSAAAETALRAQDGSAAVGPDGADWKVLCRLLLECGGSVLFTGPGGLRS